MRARKESHRCVHRRFDDPKGNFTPLVLLRPVQIFTQKTHPLSQFVCPLFSPTPFWSSALLHTSVCLSVTLSHDLCFSLTRPLSVSLCPHVLVSVFLSPRPCLSSLLTHKTSDTHLRVVERAQFDPHLRDARRLGRPQEHHALLVRVLEDWSHPAIREQVLVEHVAENTDLLCVCVCVCVCERERERERENRERERERERESQCVCMCVCVCGSISCAS